MGTMSSALQVTLHFKQQISGVEGIEGYYVFTDEAPKQGWGGPFLPNGLDDAQIKAIRPLYRAYVERQQSDPNQLPDESSLEVLRAAGNQLFQSFPETIQRRLAQIQTVALEQSRELVLTLVFETSAQSLLVLPWELLHNPEGRYFYALRGGGIIRKLYLPDGVKVEKSFRPRSILGVWAEPQGIANLADRGDYSPSPGKDGGITWLKGENSLGQMKQALDVGDYDGLHIVAHGRAGENWGDFSLALVSNQGAPQWISPDQLSVFMSNYPSIRFVYLDVCASAYHGASSETSWQAVSAYLPGGLASKLIGAGVGVVVAMQDTVSQRAAGLMAQTFYQELSVGTDLTQAMTSARQSIRLLFDDPIHWSVPAFYVQQKSREETSWNIRLVDWFLDNITTFLAPHNLLLVGNIILAGHLARSLAEASSISVLSWRSMALPIAQSVLLPVLSAWAMDAGQDQIRDKYKLNRKGWLGVFVHKYTSAAVFAMMAWFTIVLVWVFLAGTGMANSLGLFGRQTIWFFSMLGLMVAGYIGARQAVRQSLLFLRLGSNPIRWHDTFLLLTVPFIPLFLLWFFVALLAVPIKVLLSPWLILGMLLLLSARIGRD